MKTKSPKPAARTFEKGKTVSTERISPPGYGINFVDRQNNTGLPDNLKTGIENLSGISLDDAKVHYNSDKPARLQAHAYTQATDIYLASGQERHLPHEAWHLVQQKQGRVKPTQQFNGKTNINDDSGLEKEADIMGKKALQNVGNGAGVKIGVAPVRTGPSCLQRQPILPKPIKTVQQINDFLAEVAKEGSKVSVADQKRIQDFISTMSRSENRQALPTFRELKETVAYEVGGVIYKELFESTKKVVKKQGTKRSRKEKPTLENIFSDEESEGSESEMDIMSHYEKSPQLYQQSVDHSDFHQVKNVINPRNTNMLTFLGKSIVPSSINDKPNISATPKSKKKVSEKLKKQKSTDLRGQQERVFYGSHLNQSREGEFESSFDTLKSRIRKRELIAESVEPLVTKSRRGFTIRDTEGHAEQSLLRSKTWDALKNRLMQHISGSISNKDLQGIKESGNTILVTLVLNRSSCRGCGLALSVALIEFWEQLAAHLKEKLDWKKTKEKYGSLVRFVLQFPTVYEYDSEKSSSFVNLEEVLSSLISVGWEVAPIRPKIEGGMKSYEQLNTSLTKLGALPSKEDLEFYKSGGSSSTKHKSKKLKLSKEDEIEQADREFDQRVLVNNCLPEAILNRHLSLIEARRLRLSLLDNNQRIGGFLDADQPVVRVIAQQFGINTNIIIYEGNQIWRRFLVLEGGIVQDVTLSDIPIAENNSIVLERINRNHFIRKK